MATCYECGAKRNAGPCAACGVPVEAADVTGAPRGRILIATDFHGHGDPEGFHIHGGPSHTRLAGPPIELGMDQPGAEGFVQLVSTKEEHGSVEVAVSARFTVAPNGGDHVSWGLSLRECWIGEYVVRISWTGAYSVMSYQSNGPDEVHVPWTAHPAIVAGVGPRNRLRVAMSGDTMRVFINGVQVQAIGARLLERGKMHVITAPHGHSVHVALSMLEVRKT